MPAINKLSCDLLGEMLLRTEHLDIKTLALVHKSWHEAVSLESSPRVWGQLVMARAKAGVLVRTIMNSKVKILCPPPSITYVTITMFLLEIEVAHANT
jgi:hypothetical protein